MDKSKKQSVQQEVGMPLFCWLEAMMVGDLNVFSTELGVRCLDKAR